MLITKSNLCDDDTITLAIQVVDPTGVDELTVNNWQLTIAPNPNNGIFELRIKNKELKIENFELKVLNVLGEVIHHQTIESANELIDLSTQSKGIYLLKLQSENSVAVHKVMVQ